MMKNMLVQRFELDCPQWQESRRRIYTIFGVSPTICGVGRGGNTEPKILIRSANEQQNKNNSTS